jgi:hypothetical protein
MKEFTEDAGRKMFSPQFFKESLTNVSVNLYSTSTCLRADVSLSVPILA